MSFYTFASVILFAYCLLAQELVFTDKNSKSYKMLSILTAMSLILFMASFFIA